MIITEIKNINDKTFICTESDSNKKIIRNDEKIFLRAYDLITSNYTYIESEEEIEPVPEIPSWVKSFQSTLSKS